MKMNTMGVLFDKYCFQRNVYTYIRHHFSEPLICVFSCYLHSYCRECGSQRSSPRSLWHCRLSNQPTWQTLVWQVQFPLLDNVRAFSSTGCSEKVDGAALSKNCEDSLAALKSLQDIMYVNADKLASLTNEERAETKMRSLQDCIEYLAKYRH
ncbi:uncharacterized protein LOC118734200 [Rhagoletis pomonella]|uniref:uncharacterized protein LOC118734200 n=1 Tax=Rhagoletis pomonella TaxID=28610 RepID=UPI00177C6C89|nr:uncharacterized protein LOC118734200 [Rhagoletis pomonella]